jgi:hypothetical protein
MPETLAYTGQLVIVTCWCGINHAIPSDLNAWANASAKNAVHCPLGHEWVRRESEAAKVRRQLERERERATLLRSRVDQERARGDHEAARARGYKGALTKVKKRVGNGVCPCCQRSFPDLAAHMAGQHPDYADGAA